MTHSPAHQFAEEHVERFLEELQALIRIPTISTQSEHAGDIRLAAEWLRDEMKRIGFTTAEWVEKPKDGGRHPVVIGTWLEAGPEQPTVLIYGHYDVQPAEIKDGWDTDPFEPTIIEDRLYARGATDSKINTMCQLKALESLFATGNGTLPVNVKLVLEGEEESGGETLEAFAATEPDRLSADIGVICDGGMVEPDQPSLVCGLRGIISLEVTVKGPQKDLHSGHFGGSVHNPIQALTEIIAQLHDAEGRVTIPGFYDQVREFPAETRAEWEPINAYFNQGWDKHAAAPTRYGEPGFNNHERTGIRPTLELNGIFGGYTGEGVKTVLPASATAKITCRLVLDQDPALIQSRVAEHIRAITPPSVTVDVRFMEMGSRAVYLDQSTHSMRLAAEAYETHWGTPTLLEMAGGSVPIAATFDPLVNELVIMGFTHKGGGAHGPNEHIVLRNFRRGTAAAITFLQRLGESSEGSHSTK